MGLVEQIPVIDTDTHTSVALNDPRVLQHLSKRWIDHMGLVGLRMVMMNQDRPRQKAAAARTDSFSPDGKMPGSDPDFVKEQLLDDLDLSGAVMNDLFGTLLGGGRPMPDAMCVELISAINSAREEVWMEHDGRWYGSISVPHEVSGEAAVAEIRRRKEESPYRDRWVQVMLPPDNERPIGHAKYWSIFEACEHYDIPVSFHVWATRRTTGTGVPNYYIEEHTDFADFNFPLVSSLVFEGVFDRFPKLKIGMIELGWSWVVPYLWRLDHTYEMLKAEVSHLQRKPSEYLAEHFWFSTQPMEEPERLEWFDDVYELFEGSLGDKLMYSSDYPHWDFDLPQTLPHTLSVETRRKILGVNASKLYRIPLREGTGLEVEAALA